jgi:two-component system, OmpR family, sensor histidine kinase TctE
MSSKRPYSVRRRLSLWLLVSIVVIGGLAMLDTYREAVATADTALDRVLAGSALAIADRVVVADDGELEVDIPYVALEMLTSTAQDRVFYRIDGPPGTFITGYEDLPTARGSEARDIAFSDGWFRGEPIRLAVLERQASSGLRSIPFSVTVAETTIAREQLANTLLLRSALRLGLIVLAAAVVAWFAVTAALKPLYRLREAIASRNPGDLSPIAEPVPREVQGLVDTVNSFMERLGSVLDALRHFTGNASHQIRTPLAIIRTQLALSRRAATLDEARGAAAAGDEAVAHAERILAQLLLMARIDAAASQRMAGSGSFDLADLARERTADNIVRARAAGVDLGFEGDRPASVAGDALLIGELVGNLIDNAINHAGPGTETTVRVIAPGDGAGEVVLEVEDDGVGIDPASLALVRRRFGRGSNQAKQGAGLGLPIVEDIAALFGGRLDLLPGRGGRGLCARIAFPAPADARKVGAPNTRETSCSFSSAPGPRSKPISNGPGASSCRSARPSSTAPTA